MAAPVTTGTPVNLALGTTATPGAQAITVPADAQIALFFFMYWADTNGAGLSTLTSSFASGGFDTTAQLTTTNAGGGALPAIGVARAVVTATGSQTITPTWGAAPSEGPVVTVVFVKDVNTSDYFLDVQLDHDTATTAPSVVLDTETTALALAYHGRFSSSASPPGDFVVPACTNLQTQGNNQEGSRLAQVNSPAAGTTTITAADPDYSGLVAIAIKENAGGSAATLSAPTPSGTLGTPTTATVGATTNQNTGTLYVVVDSAANLSGVTATQIKAGQKANGTSALASGNSSISTTSPTVAITGLTGGTAYSYAIVQNNGNGDSNVVTGTFTTASAPTITNADDEVFVNGEVIAVAGTGFGASQGSGAFYLCPTNDVNDAGRVQQTVTSWGDTSASITIVRGGLSLDTNLFLFVVTNSSLSNATGYTVQITTPPVALDPITTCYPG